MGVKLYDVPDGRCPWADPRDALYLAYHDEEWGVVERDPRALWEKLVLDGFQAGLAWITILRKREAFRAAFAGFDPEAVARFGEADRARLLADAGIVRSPAKIDAAIAGARAFLAIARGGRGFRRLAVVVRRRRADRQPLVARRSGSRRDRRGARDGQGAESRGFKFCGPVISYAFMQATGMVNDHLTGCFRHAELAA